MHTVLAERARGLVSVSTEEEQRGAATCHIQHPLVVPMFQVQHGPGVQHIAPGQVLHTHAHNNALSISFRSLALLEVVTSDRAESYISQVHMTGPRRCRVIIWQPLDPCLSQGNSCSH